MRLLLLGIGAIAAILTWREFTTSELWADPDDPRIVNLGIERPSGE